MIIALNVRIHCTNAGSSGTNSGEIILKTRQGTLENCTNMSLNLNFTACMFSYKRLFLTYKQIAKIK